MRYWYIAMVLMLAGCGKELLEPELIDRGVLPLSPYVAIGGSETAGFADGALHLQAQQYSYPALIAQQLRLVGGGSFTQPLTIDSGGYWFNNGLLYNKLAIGYVTDCNGNKVATPVRGNVDAGTLESFTSASQAAPYGNLAVPFLKTSELNQPDLANTSSYYRRMGSDNNTLQQTIVNRSPRLFTIWLGLDNILEHAISGTSPIEPIQFYNHMVPLLDSLVADTAAAGFIATVPDVTKFPFFIAIPYNGLVLEQSEADALNQLYAGTGMGFQQGNNPFVIEDPNAPGGKRQILPTEKLMLSLPSDSIKCFGLGANVPISARYVLDVAELGIIQYLTTGYNMFIKELAAEKELHVVDLYDLYEHVADGVTINGMKYSNEFLYGSFFSLDGINPSKRGAAIIANKFITAMNLQYKASIPYVSVVSVPGIKIP